VLLRVASCSRSECLLVHHRGFIGMKGIVMEDLSARTAQEVLDDHMKLDEHFGAEEDWRRIVEEDIRRNVSEDIVILINRAHSAVTRGSGSWLGCSVRNYPNTARSSTPTGPSKEGWLSWSGPTRTDPAHLRPQLRGLRRVLPQTVQGDLQAGRTGVDRQQPPCAHDAPHLSRSGSRFSTGCRWWITWL
jgi:hypothetical protein